MSCSGGKTGLLRAACKLRRYQQPATRERRQETAYDLSICTPSPRVGLGTQTVMLSDAHAVLNRIIKCHLCSAVCVAG